VNVLLINSNRMKPAIAPIGLDYLADLLHAAGHEVRLLDLCFAEAIPAEIARACREFAPEVVGLTVRNTDDCYFSSQAFFLPEIKAMIQLVRKATDAPVVLGGVGFSVSPAAGLEECGADFGIVGEGELAFPELLKTMTDGRDWGRVPNLVHREGTTILTNPIVPVDLAALPARRRALVDNALYFRRGGQAGFETKRGCALKCIYCADPVVKGATVRLLPPAQAVGELSALLAQGIDHFHTCDSEFNLPRGHAVEVCRAIIAAGLGEKIRWFTYCAPTPFDDELAELFRRAGCAGIDFGVDSGSLPMLRQLGRHFSLVDVARAAQLCRKYNLPFMFDLLLGGPGETHDTLRESIHYIRSLRPDCVGLSIGVRLYQGTALTRRLQAECDPASHPDLHGCKQANPGLLKPLFYISPVLGPEITDYVRELVGDDPRFFLPDNSPKHQNYNYNENTALVRAIEQGARGAYWNILRQQRQN
jgi:radical SAM superfamily enzyme YgiQ (UPF0313 family)